MARDVNGVLMCSACGYGEIGPDITGRPMCYGCGSEEMAPKCPGCGHSMGQHTSRGCAMDCACMAGSGGHLADVARLANGMLRLDTERRGSRSPEGTEGGR